MATSTDRVEALVVKNLLLSKAQKDLLLSELKGMDDFEKTALILVLEKNEASLKAHLKEAASPSSMKSVLKKWGVLKRKTTRTVHESLHKQEVNEAESDLTKSLS
jgi:hypothetical protein